MVNHGKLTRNYGFIEFTTWLTIFINIISLQYVKKYGLSCGKSWKYMEIVYSIPRIYTSILWDHGHGRSRG